MIFNISGKRHEGSEDDLVKFFIKEFKNEILIFGNYYGHGNYYEQVRIPQIRRISDLVIEFEGRLINVEFKLMDHKCLKSQAIDHLKWCDYSYVCIPASCYAFYPKTFYEDMKNKGIGIIIGTGLNFIEILRAYKNTYKNGKDRDIRDFVNNKIKSEPTGGN